MSNYHVFYAGQLYGEYDYWRNMHHVPDGAYIRALRGSWYLQFHGTKIGINLCDIPNEVRVLCLLLDISI